MGKAVIGPVRFSFVNIFEPKAINGVGEPKYSLTVLIPKSDQAQVQKIQAAIEEAKKDGVNTVFNGSLPKTVRTTVHDGDGTRPNGEEFGEECKGHFVMTCTTSAKYPPQVIVGEDRHPAMPGEVKSGDYGYVSVNFAAYNRSGNKGVGSYLNNVFKTRDGDPLGYARPSALDDFKDLRLDPSEFETVAIDPITGEKITLPPNDPIPFG